MGSAAGKRQVAHSESPGLRYLTSAYKQCWLVYAVAPGIIFFVAFIGVASGLAQAWTIVGFWTGLMFV